MNMLTLITSYLSETCPYIRFISLTFHGLKMDSRRFCSTIIFVFKIFTLFAWFIIFHKSIKIFKFFTKYTSKAFFCILSTACTPNTLISEFCSSRIRRITFIINDSNICFSHIKIINFDSEKWFNTFSKGISSKSFLFFSFIKLFKTRLDTNTDYSANYRHRNVIQSWFT